MKNQKNLKLSIPCQCVGGAKYCGLLEIYKDDTGEIELNFKPKGERKVIAGVWITNEVKKKLIKFMI